MLHAIAPVLLSALILLLGPSHPLVGQGTSAGATPPTTGVEEASLRDLRGILDTGLILQDTNDDDVVDFVATRILLPPSPTESEVAAAANLAARLGYETSAMDLGLSGTAGTRRRYPEPVILVGIGAVEAAGMADHADPIRGGLAPGQGIVAYLPAVGGLSRGGVALVGYDATGLLSAAEYLSGRYPGVWSPGGTSWREVSEKVELFVAAEAEAGGSRDESSGEGHSDSPGGSAGGGAGRGEGGAGKALPQGISVTLDRIVVDGARPGVARARVTVQVADTATYDALEGAFSGMDAAEAEGKAGGVGTSPAPADTPSEGVDDPSADASKRDDSRPSLGGLEFRDVHRLDVRLVGPGSSRTITLRPEKPWRTAADDAFRPSNGPPFSLSGVYSVGGLYRDTNRDLVPDETVAYLSLSRADAGSALIDLASRIGLETAGIRLPLVRVEAQEDDPTDSGLPIFVGTGHYQVQRLQKEKKLPDTGVGSGEGFVRLVDDAFGDRTALAVAGGDAPGLDAALGWLARRAPYLWTYGKGEYGLADAETEVRRFLQARDGPGQVALALAKLEAWMDRMDADSTPVRVQVELAALEAPEGLRDLVASAVRRRVPDAEVEVSTFPTGFGVGDTIFSYDWEIPWEVDEARRILEEEVYPGVRRGESVEIQLRLSEPPEVREALEEEIRERLEDGGAGEARVRVLSAYKQGYSWIHDVLLPQLRDRGVASVDLTYHTLEESEEVRWQTIAAETRWLQEVYPFDAVLARELEIPDSAITFHPTREKDPIYTLEARDTAGAVVLKESFTPKYVVRPFFDLFPEYERVRVTTGWIRASSGGRTLADERIATDPERFWDRLQTEAYGEIVRYVMDIQDGAPNPANAPFFDVFQVDLRLSEPDYRIGVDEEAISSLEALHEDIFFETHTLFDLIGGRYQTSLSYPGRVLPFMDPSGAGEPGRAHLTLTGKDRGAPRLVLRSWTSEGGEPTLRTYDLDPMPVEPPRITGVTLAAGLDGLRELRALVPVADSVDPYPAFQGRGTEGSIDRQFPNTELLTGMVAALGRAHAVGLFPDALSWDRVETLALDFRMEKDSTFQKTVVLPRSGRPASTDNPALVAEGFEYAGEPLVQWETPISPEENEDVLARLGTFPGVNVYYLTDSYLGHRVWAADFLPAQEARYISQAKLNALKPTIVISGREHANEVSSTSHILRLGELLVTDSSYKDLLRRVNVVLHPMTNPDGAALAYERQLVNPHHMLHAGRPGALGVDATVGERSEDPVYPEARARRLLREAWLPDVFLNPHGYPSHEWVQYFAGYSAWVRSRRGGARDWWVPRSWFIPGFSWVDDEDNPDYRVAQFAILDTMAAAMTSAEAVEAANRRLYARYRKYEVQDREGFTEYFHNGMLVNMRLRGAESVGTGLYSPRITYFSVTTEAPDETARGPWLQLMGEAGVTHTSAALRYLANGRSEVKRESEAFRGVVTRKVFRVKPVLPAGPGSGDPGKETQ